VTQAATPDRETLLESAMADQEAGRASDAEAAYRQILRLRPSDAAALNNLGLLLMDSGRLEESREILVYGVHENPCLPEMHANLGLACKRLGYEAEAVVAFCRALQLRPNYPEVLNNFGSLLHDLGELDHATAHLRRAAAERPDWALAHFNLGVNLLLDGQFEAGWQEYAWRWNLGDGPIEELRRRYAHIPQWRGESLAGKTILLHGEQGYGDSLQFVRYVPMLAAQGARIKLQVPQPLVRLFATVAGVAAVLGSDEPTPDADFRAGLMDVPGVVGTRRESIPADAPYLSVPAGAERRQEPSAARDQLRIGLVWAGNASHENDAKRSLNISSLIPLLSLPGIRWFSLQLGPARKQLAQLPPSLQPVDLASEIRDFADTAAIITGLDLVIAVDTAIVHLAGALGCPAWILLPPNPDWRWLAHGDTSPWYPSATLVRRRREESWDRVIDRMAAAILRASPV
jgi:hypothetical protein